VAIFFVFASAALISCTLPDDTSRIVPPDPTAAAARKEMVGLTEADLRMCAGFPTATADVGKAGQIWTYEHAAQRGNLNVAVPTVSVAAIPVAGGSVNVASGGYCNTQVRIDGGHVVEVAYAGDNNTTGHLDRLCVSTVDACVEYARQHRTGINAPSPKGAGKAERSDTR
jgi:hypothetical protein